MDVLDLEELYGLYHPHVYRFAFYLCGRRADAEDIAADTFLRLWKAPDDVRLSTVKAYLFAIARHLYLDGLRGRHAETTLGGDFTDPAPLQDAEAEGRGELEAVLELLGRLPEIDRSALLMRVGDGMPYVEIAAVLGLGLSATKVKVHRARIRIAEWHAAAGRRRR